MSRKLTITRRLESFDCSERIAGVRDAESDMSLDCLLLQAGIAYLPGATVSGICGAGASCSSSQEDCK